MRQAKQHVGHGARVVQRQNGGRREAGHRLRGARLGHAVEPGLERCVVGQDQVGLGAGLVDEAAEADDVGNLGDGLADVQSGRRGENRIGLVEQQHLRRVLLPERIAQRVEAGQAGLHRRLAASRDGGSGVKPRIG